MILWNPSALATGCTSTSSIGRAGLFGDKDELCAERVGRYLENARRARARATAAADPSERKFNLMIAAGWERIAGSYPG